MAEFFPPVLFEIKAKATEAIATFGEVNKELAKMEKNGVLASGALGRMEKASKYAGAALLGLGGAFAVFGAASIKTLDEVEKSQANLEVAIKNTGVSFEDAKPAVDAHAKSMMALGFTYQDTYAALAKMTAASGSPKVALDSLSVAADLARAKQISLAEAGTLVARASIGQAKGLGDLGIALGKTLPKGASMAQIFKAIEDRVGGASKAFKNTLSGSIQVAQANFQALEIQVGTKLVPTLTKITTWITDTGIPGLEKLGKWISNNKALFGSMAAIIGAIWVAPKVEGIITSINLIKKAYEGLRTVLIATGIAEAFATAGVSVGTATAALAAAAAAGYLIYETPKIPGLVSSVFGSKTAAPTSSSVGNANPYALGMPNLAGKGVKTVAPKPKSPVTIVQQNTIYASNTNDVYKKLSTAAKNGVSLGGTR